MKKSLAVLAVVGSLSLTGCSWWNGVTNDPITSVQTFEQSVEVVMNDAQVAWQIVQPFLPAAQAASLNAKFQTAVLAVNHALSALNDAVQTAQDIKKSNPDFSGAIKAVSDAVQQVLAIIDEVKASLTPAPSDAGASDGGLVAQGRFTALPALEEAHSALDSIQKHYVAH
jgi:hypothetical protein